MIACNKTLYKNWFLLSMHRSVAGVRALYRSWNKHKLKKKTIFMYSKGLCLKNWWLENSNTIPGKHQLGSLINQSTFLSHESNLAYLCSWAVVLCIPYFLFFFFLSISTQIQHCTAFLHQPHSGQIILKVSRNRTVVCTCFNFAAIISFSSLKRGIFSQPSGILLY